jgi:thioredoxin 1
MTRSLAMLALRAAFPALACLAQAAAPMRAAAADLLYPSASSARADVQSALQQAAASHKRVLVEFGANWCSDCRVLEQHFRRAENADLLEAHFVLVHVNVGDSGIDHNTDLAQSYGIPLDRGVPALAVLESDGRVVYSQKNGEFEAMRSLDPKSVNEFLTRWSR